MTHPALRDHLNRYGAKSVWGGIARQDNTGRDIAAKLAFLARYETIVTNSYHGVFWGTLLGRKVVCVQFKNGLFSFRHAPAYFQPDQPAKAFDEAIVHEDALEVSRQANIRFYLRVQEQFGDV